MKKETDDTKSGTDRKIDVDNPEQMKRWCSELQCNEMRLKNAVRAVGASEDAVRRYMRKDF